MKKRLLLFGMILVIVIALCACGGRESPAEDFQFEMVNGEIVITGYVGVDREIHIPKKIDDRPVTIIGEEAFSGYDLTYIAMPDTVREIREMAFSGCRCLEKVQFSERLEIIMEDAFANCEVLEEIQLPDALLKINDDAFRSSGLVSVSLPDGLQLIGNNAFANCEKLTTLTIPDDVKLIIYTESSSASSQGISVLVTRFSSFVGGTSMCQYAGSYNGYKPEDTDFEKLHTTVIVKEGSYAHQQLREYDSYGVIPYKFK